MRCEISVDGILVVYPNSDTELFAFEQWKNQNWVSSPSIERRHNGYFRESSVTSRYKDAKDVHSST